MSGKMVQWMHSRGLIDSCIVDEIRIQEALRRDPRKARNKSKECLILAGWASSESTAVPLTNPWPGPTFSAKTLVKQ